MNLLKEMKSRLGSKLDIPRFVVDQLQYLVYTGSVAYGVSNDLSDMDLYGFCIPNKNLVFPHLNGEIPGFGKQTQRFEQYQKHHIDYKEKEYDLTIYSIVKFFQLCMQNNPNMVDVLFVPQRCILHSTSIGNYIREHRKDFLHKGSWHKFKGYAYQQMHKMLNKTPVGKRKILVEKYGYDTKFAYHVVRLIGEVEQILIEHDLDLEKNREQLKSIRRGEWSKEQIQTFFSIKENSLEESYDKSTLRHSPDEKLIKGHLINCLEMHFGSLSESVITIDKATNLVHTIKKLIEERGY